MTTKSDPEITALQAVYLALKPLSADDRRKVLASVQALLGTVDAPIESRQMPSLATPSSSARPLSLVELIKDKQPKTNIDLITLFAYFRDQFEGQQRFGRNDLRGYFSKAKQNPPSNFDRDFVEAVKRGWLHEDGADSYITSRGMEAIAAGFPSERKAPKGRKGSRRLARATPAKKRQAKRKV